MEGKLKRNKTGQRGIKNVDKVQDNELFIDEFEEKGKSVRLGKYRISHQIVKRLASIALELQTSRSGLIRSILVDFIKYYDEAKMIGGKRFFEPETPISGWVQERADFAQLLSSMISKDLLMQEGTKNPEVLMLSQQLVVLAKMLNLTNKNVL